MIFADQTVIVTGGIGRACCELFARESAAVVVAFLPSDDASDLTRQCVYPDGGRLGLNYTVPVPNS